MSSPFKQTLLIDADDTLWENNIYFERVIQQVQELLRSFAVSPADFRRHLDDLEREHIARYGYGTQNFTRSLVQAFADFLPAGADGSLQSRVEQLGLGIMNQPVELLDGVSETLEYLGTRHWLYLVTKGDPSEQGRKIASSGLRDRFRSVEIVSEKNEETYRSLVDQHSWDLSRTWMVGNSPRSDINPAVSAGLRAVFIPHPHTWKLEHEEPVQDPRVLTLEKFQDLRAHF